jgi:hypothetical protein
MATRGPNWTPSEHKLLAQSFIATSEDAIVGTDQKGADFQEKMHVNYKRIVADHNRVNNTRYHDRKCTSIFTQFKKLSAAVLKFIGVEDNAGEPPTGDNDRAIWQQGINETFSDRFPHFKNMLDSVLYCKDTLQDSPKWEAFEKKKEEGIQRRRPQGTKKAKQESQDEKLVKRVLSVSTEEKSKKKHMKNKDDFMKKMGTGIDVLAFCSPRTQKKLAAELMRERIKRMKSERRNANVANSTVMSSVSCEVNSDQENGHEEEEHSSDESERTFLSETQRRLDAIEDSPTDARLARERAGRNNNREDDEDDDYE